MGQTSRRIYTEERPNKVRNSVISHSTPTRRRIFGQPCTLDELLDPAEEWEIGEKLYSFEGGDADIIEVVQQEIGLGRGDVEEIESDDEPDRNSAPPLKEVMKMCRILEEHSMTVCTTGAFKALREYQGHLQEMSRGGEKQTTLDTINFM